MTAFIAVREADRAHLLIDGAVYTADGTLVGIARKVADLPACKAAFGLRGQLYIGNHIEDRFAGFESFDALLDAMPAILSEVRASYGDQWEIVVVGMTAHGPAIYYFEAHRPEPRLRRIEDRIFIAGPQPDVATFRDAGFEPFDEDDVFDVLTHGLPVMEALRRTPAVLSSIDGPARGFGVGAFVTHTVVSASDVLREMVCLWPDVLGQAIDPTRRAVWKKGEPAFLAPNP